MRQFGDWLKLLGLPGLLLFAVIENMGPPMPGGTDVLLLVLAASPHADARLCAIMATVGALIGSAIFFEITRKGGEKFLARYMSSRRGLRFCEFAHRYGLATVFISSLIPLPILPFKLFAACAGAMGVSRMRFILVVAAGRIPRYAALAYLGKQLGAHSTTWLKSHTWYMLAIAAILTLALYGFIRRADANRLRDQRPGAGGQ